MSRPRKAPYSAIGIKRIPCARCGAPSVHQWQICSDGNQYRGLGLDCDIALNKTVLRFMGFPDWQGKLADYAVKARLQAAQE